MAIRSGEQYKAGLRDNRRVFINGELVTDVTANGAFSGVIETIAALHDAQFDPRYQDALTQLLPETGERVCRTYHRAETQDEMMALLRCDHARADMTFGVMGRLTDFMSAWLTDSIASFEFTGHHDAAERSRRYHAHVRDNDLVLTHALIDPQTDRSKLETPDESVQLVERRPDGIVVRGARLLSTLAPVSDEVYIGPFMPRLPGEESKALIFGLPMNAPGLKIVCREGYDHGRSRTDRPLSSRFDEGDAILIFDDVFVPDERIILAGDVAAYNSLLPNFPGYVMMQAVARSAAKLRLLAGIASLAAKATGRDKLPRYQEMLGEMTTLVHIGEGLEQATALEIVRQVSAQRAGKPLWTSDLPGEPATQPRVGNASIVTFFPNASRTCLDHLRMIAGSGGLIFSERDYAQPEIRGLIDRYVKGASIDAGERLKIMKLVWDITGEQFGARQALYERYYSGDPIKNVTGYFHSPKLAEAEALARRLLA